MKNFCKKILESFSKGIASSLGLVVGLFIFFGFAYAAVTITTTTVTPGTPMTASLWNAVKTDLDNLAAEFNDIGNFNNVSLTSLQANDILEYDGTNWINVAEASGGGGGGGVLSVYDATDSVLGYFLDIGGTFLYYWDAANKEIKTADNRTNTNPNVITYYSSTNCNGAVYMSGDEQTAVGIGCTGSSTCTSSPVIINPDSVATNRSWQSRRYTGGSCQNASQTYSLRTTISLDTTCCSGATCGLCDIKP